MKTRAKKIKEVSVKSNIEYFQKAHLLKIENVAPINEHIALVEKELRSFKNPFTALVKNGLARLSWELYDSDFRLVQIVPDRNEKASKVVSSFARPLLNTSLDTRLAIGKEGIEEFLLKYAEHLKLV